MINFRSDVYPLLQPSKYLKADDVNTKYIPLTYTPIISPYMVG